LIVFPKLFEYSHFILALKSKNLYYKIINIPSLGNTKLFITRRGIFYVKIIKESDILFLLDLNDYFQNIKKSHPEDYSKLKVFVCGSCGSTADLNSFAIINEAIKYDRGIYDRNMKYTIKNITLAKSKKSSSNIFKKMDDISSLKETLNYKEDNSKKNELIKIKTNNLSFCSNSLSEFWKSTVEEVKTQIINKHKELYSFDLEISINNIYFDMETYDFFEICNRNGINSIGAFRIVSDNMPNRKREKDIISINELNYQSINNTMQRCFKFNLKNCLDDILNYIEKNTTIYMEFKKEEIEFPNTITKLNRDLRNCYNIYDERTIEAHMELSQDLEAIKIYNETKIKWFRQSEILSLLNKNITSIPKLLRDNFVDCSIDEIENIELLCEEVLNKKRIWEIKLLFGKFKERKRIIENLKNQLGNNTREDYSITEQSIIEDIEITHEKKKDIQKMEEYLTKIRETLKFLKAKHEEIKNLMEKNRKKINNYYEDLLI